MVEIPDELIAKENELAARVTQQEVGFVLAEAANLAKWNGEERRCPVERRAAYRQMRLESAE